MYLYRLFWVFLLWIAVVLTGCGSTHGVIEFQDYTKAFDLQIEAGNYVLDSVAVAERVVGMRRIKRGGGVPDFKPEDAAYWVPTVEPPITSSIRSSINVLKSYNEALGALANGESAKALAARNGKLITDLAATGLLLGEASGLKVPATGVSELIKRLGTNVNVLSAVFEFAATRSGRDAFRKQLIEAAPLMESFLVELRDATPNMFQLLKRAKTVPGELVNPISTADLKKLEKERALLAGWVLLMDKTLIAMNAAVEAVQSENTHLIVSSAVSEAALELRVVAEKVKAIRAAP